MLDRRRFLINTGAASLAMPSFLAACTKQGSLSGALAEPPPDNPFLTWFEVDEAVIRQVLAELSARGADFADLYFQHSRSTSISMEDGIIGKAYTDIEQGVGLRCVVGDQVGYAYTEDLTIESMLAAARTAAAIASSNAATPPASFSYANEGTRYKIDVPWSDVGIDQKLPLLQKAEKYARQGDPNITKVSAWWSDSHEKVLVATLDGNIQVDSRPMSRLWVNCTATKDGVTQSNSSNLAGRRGMSHYSEDQLQLVAKQAVDRTMVLFDAVRPKAGEMPVALAAGASGILLHEAIGHGMEADFNRKGVSIYSDMMGKKVAEPFVTIVDDGTQDGERGALNVDDEGVPAGKTVLVENGIMASYLHDRISAKHYGLPSTGSGRRQSFRHSPMPRMRSTYMLDGPHTEDEIIESVEYGIMAETFTNGQVNIGAGDFTFYIKNGWLIENGKKTSPIKDVNIIGNGPKALEKVTMAANNSQLDTGGWTCGKNGQMVPVSQGLPTVLVSSLTVGGVDA